MTFLATVAGVLGVACVVLFIEFNLLPASKDPLVVMLAAPRTKQIPNFGYVHPYLLRGGMPSPEGVKWLKDNGISTIVDLRERENSGVLVESLLSETLDLNYINIPVKRLPTTEQIERFLAIVEQSKSKGQRVFVHCAHGSDRTGIFVGSCRVLNEKWRPTMALAEMLQGGFLIHKFYPHKMLPGRVETIDAPDGAGNSKRGKAVSEPISARVI
jgi:Protein tyrosine/serine phosphatase